MEATRNDGADRPHVDTTDGDNNPAITHNTAETTAVPMSSIFYVMESFKATATPVTITMILSACAANFIRTEASAEIRSAQLTSSYSAIAVSEDASSSQKFGFGLINGLVIIAVLTAMTFLVVLLYKYRCMKILHGYMTLSITFLLGYFGGVLFYEAIQRHELWVTKISFALAIWNFTVVGIYSLFFQTGVPAYVGQGYLICISVILAWELSHFSEITAWVLLVLLALYDLYAVLTPCGPLKALVNLMGQEGAPQLQGLLYEAQLPPQARRQPPPQQQRQQTRAQRQQQEQTQGSSTPSPTPAANTSEEPATDQNSAPASGIQTRLPDGESEATESSRREVESTTNARSDRADASPVDQASSSAEDEKKSEDDPVEEDFAAIQRQPLDQLTPIPPPVENNALRVVSQSTREMVVSPSQDEFETVSRPTGTIPLALAKLYKIPLVDERPTDGGFTPDQLKALVQVYFPRNGGRMERVPSSSPPATDADAERRSRFGFRRNRREPEPENVHYHVIDRHGVVKRTVFVGDEDGKVYRVLDETEQEEQERTMPSSIKLGLGDFIFYSVLVSKASLYSFTTFAACVVGILAGLLLTLLLLAIQGKALPALPISIFFGVAFYLPTRYVLEPWIHEMFWSEFYM